MEQEVADIEEAGIHAGTVICSKRWNAVNFCKFTYFHRIHRISLKNYVRGENLRWKIQLFTVYLTYFSDFFPTRVVNIWCKDIIVLGYDWNCAI